ncbi:MAG: hypothetical protein WD080_07275 [Egibacteraceae bacterium]
MTHDPEQRPDFGPGGYLPRRAAQRARKIVLREQMGMGWPIAAVAAAVVVALVGAVFLFTATRGGPPGPPFVPVAPLTAADPDGAATFALDGAVGGVDAVLVVRAGGLRTYAAPGVAVTYCAASRRLETADRVWNLRGRLVGGDGDSLRPLATRLHDGQVYVDPTAPGPAPAPAPAGETPTCALTG